MATSNPTQPSVWLTSLIWPFSFAYRLALCVVLSWLLTVGLALLFAAFVWEPGSGPKQLNQALMVIVEDMLMGGLSIGSSLDAPRFTLMCANIVYEWLFVHTGIEAIYAAVNANVMPTGLGGTAHQLVARYLAELEIAMAATRLFGAKLGLLVTAAPLLLGVYAAGVVDGLVQRYIRAQGGGRESSFIYHRSKFITVMLLGTLVMCVVLTPLALRPRLVVPATAGAILVLAVYQWRF
jgi:integrating conjugative element membrane protein (TIGR03747 family)